MMDDRTGNVNSNSVARRTSRAREVGQYTEPGEISDEVKAYLDQTHPLRQNREAQGRVPQGRESQGRVPQNRDSYVNRSSQREDVEEVREARMQRVGSEIEGIKRQPQQEGEPTRYVSRRARNMSEEPQELIINRNPQSVPSIDEFDSRVPYVSVMPPRKKTRTMEDVGSQTAPPQRRPQRKPEEAQRFDGAPQRRPAPQREPERSKQEHLDRLYSDYDDEDEGRMGKILIVVAIVAVILIAFLMYRNISTSAQLEELQAQVTQSEDITVKYEELQLENMRLQEEIESLQNPVITMPEEDLGEAGEVTNVGGGSSSSSSSSLTSGDSYTVVSGDSFWAIATKVYGDGTRYAEILSANGMTENDALSVGQVLTIPR
ncbi:LysM peptidoglycan-binding domain-containing protein [Chakrabartyella piscis]|uniref:LysM peptidoglycan-binding domain-containing protein n=1 Tax=Chakrabartyella piscis TaxID=2918914 RepID=UPI002958B395|nr:LysM peptidoglycan-binding domain-containing protein [Chakrabartyella piscis]